MSQDFGKLNTDPLFMALTRPAMVMGVTYSWFTLEGLIWMTYFINSSEFMVLIPGAIVTHLIGFMACSHEPRWVELIMIWSQTDTRCMNKRHHGNTISYDLF